MPFLHLHPLDVCTWWCHVWLQALRELDAAARGPDASEETRLFLQGALLRRLQDEDQGVVATVLGLPSLLHLPAAALYEALTGSLAASTEVIHQHAREADKSAARAAARQVRPPLPSSAHYGLQHIPSSLCGWHNHMSIAQLCRPDISGAGPHTVGTHTPTTHCVGMLVQALQVLAGDFVAGHSSYRERVAGVLLDHLLSLPAARKLATTAAKLAKRLDHPLLNGNARRLSMHTPTCLARGGGHRNGHVI